MATEALRFLNAQEIEDRGLWIGEDNRVYRISGGLVKAFLPADTPGDPFSQFMGIDEDKLIEPERVKFLFDELMNKYTREVWVWWFAHRVQPKTFRVMIPRQRGTMGGVNIEDADTALEQIGPDYRFVGTIHTHPGAWCDPSGTDLATWAKPEFSGLHMILGRNGHYTLNVALRGRHWKYPEGVLPTDSWNTEWETQEHKSLDETLLEPKPIVYGGHGHWTKHSDTKEPTKLLGGSSFRQVSFWRLRTRTLVEIGDDAREDLAKLVAAELGSAVQVPEEVTQEDQLFPRLVTDYTNEELDAAEKAMDDEFASIRSQARQELARDVDRLLPDDAHATGKQGLQILTIQQLQDNEDLENLADEVVEEGGAWFDADRHGEVTLQVLIRDGRVFVVEEGSTMGFTDIEYFLTLLVDTKKGGVSVLRDDPTSLCRSHG